MRTGVLPISRVGHTLSELGRNFDNGRTNSKNVDSWAVTKVASCPLLLEKLFKDHVVACDFTVAV